MSEFALWCISTDGRMKLRRMGITEQNVADIENFLDPRFKALGDWLQDDFLVATRNEYNETRQSTQPRMKRFHRYPSPLALLLPNTRMIWSKVPRGANKNCTKPLLTNLSCQTTEDAIRKNKIERTEAYFNLVGRLSDSLRGSIENAKAFREAEKARISEIHRRHIQ